MQKEQKTYQRITHKEREEISRGLAQGLSSTKIANNLDRSGSTIDREIQRNSVGGVYRAHSAEKKAQNRAATRKRGKRILLYNKALRDYVHRHLQKEVVSLNKLSNHCRSGILTI